MFLCVDMKLNNLNGVLFCCPPIGAFYLLVTGRNHFY